MLFVGSLLDVVGKLKVLASLSFHDTGLRCSVEKVNVFENLIELGVTLDAGLKDHRKDSGGFIIEEGREKFLL